MWSVRIKITIKMVLSLKVHVRVKLMKFFRWWRLLNTSEKKYLLMLASKHLKLKNIKPNVIIEGMLLVQVLRSACLYLVTFETLV